MNKKITIIILLVICSSCKNFIAELFINKGLKNYNQIETYEGIICEKGILPNHESVKTFVRYKKPGLMMAKTLSPDILKGDYFGFDGKTIYIYYAKLKFGILISGINDVIPDSDLSIQQRLRKNAWRIINDYDIDYRGRQNIAQRSTHLYQLIHHNNNQYSPKEWVWNDIEFSIPLKLTMYTQTDTLFYKIEYEQITFNQGIEKKQFEYEFPLGTMIAKWDLSGKNYSPNDIKQSLNFPIQIPHHLPESFNRKKIVKSENSIPAICLIYSDGIYHMLLSEMKAYGLTVDYLRGISIPSINHTAKLNFFGDEIVISWVKNDILFLLSSNLPYNDVIGIAEKI